VATHSKLIDVIRVKQYVGIKESKTNAGQDGLYIRVSVERFGLDAYCWLSMDLSSGGKALQGQMTVLNSSCVSSTSFSSSLE